MKPKSRLEVKRFERALICLQNLRIPLKRQQLSYIDCIHVLLKVLESDHGLLFDYTTIKQIVLIGRAGSDAVKSLLGKQTAKLRKYMWRICLIQLE